MSIPFNLERAKAGDKFRIIEKPYLEIMDWHYFKDNQFPVFVQYRMYGENLVGRHKEHELEMIPKEKVMWIRVYKDCVGYYYPSHRVYDTMELANSEGSCYHNLIYHSTIPVTITENK